MWMRRGCCRLLGVCLAIVWGMLSVSQAEAGFGESAKAPVPVTSPAPATPSHPDFTPRCQYPDLNLDASDNDARAASPLDLPDAWDFHTGQKADDHLVSRLVGNKPDRSVYSLFWDEANHGDIERSMGDLGVDMKNAVPVVVPLPPGVWAGIAMLGGIAIHQIRRHRRLLAA